MNRKCLSILLAITAVSAAILNFPGAGCTRAETVATPPGVNCVASSNLAGSKTPFSPEYTFNLGLNYLHPLANGMSIMGDINTFFSDEYKPSSLDDPRLVQDAYERIDIRLALNGKDGRWSLAAYARNATDSQILATAVDNPGNLGSTSRSLLRGRMLGLQAQLNFGE